MGLDELCDEILIHILSMVSIKDAVATSILSSRWRYLWRFTRISLDFDFDITPHGPFRDQHDIDRYLVTQRQNFINWVNTVVDQHLGDIYSFRACYPLTDCDSDTCSVDKWIKFAMSSTGLERFELNFRGHASFDNPYVFSRHCDKRYVGFRSLKVLRLFYVLVTGEDVERLLSSAPLVERLSVCGSSKLLHLRVSGQSLALKHMEIFWCSFLESVEICDLVNLVSLSFGGQRVEAENFILKNVPQLVELNIFYHFYGWKFEGIFSCCLSQIVVLKLFDRPRGTVYEPFSYPFLPNVKQLYLTILNTGARSIGLRGGGVSNLRLILDAFPNLNRLVFHMQLNDKIPPMDARDNRGRESGRITRNVKEMRGKLPRRPHDCLKEVQILEYCNQWGAIDRVMYLVENCVALEKIVIYCNYINNNVSLLSKQQILDHEERARRHAMTQLKREVPSTIEFVCQ